MVGLALVLCGLLVGHFTFLMGQLSLLVGLA